MMREYITFFLILFCLTSVSRSVMARLQFDMQDLSVNLAVVERTSEVNELKTALENMRSAALTARRIRPLSLYGKSVKKSDIEDYRHGYDVLIGQIENMMLLVNEGRITEAKAAAEQLKETRNIWHMKYWR
ncbi:cytochrome b562 [Salmonella enterica subsp. enterica serovar Ngili]|nr:cytochrome b562 [Salmonella enterica subsp. enterica serovar Ngili]